MKLIIAGSRGIKSIYIVHAAAELCNIDIKDIEEIISGGARGIDASGEAFSRDLDIDCVVFPADWDKYGKSAGYKRNIEMAEYADELLAIWDGESKGTKHMIDIMRKLKKSVHILEVKVHDSTIA